MCDIKVFIVYEEEEVRMVELIEGEEEDEMEVEEYL